MNPEETTAFLKQPMIADLATTRPDGSPHVAPVWFLYDGDTVKVMAGRSAVKMRNIRHSPEVSVSIATKSEPYRYALVSGSAEISYDGIPELLHTMSVHYRGKVEGEKYARQAIEDVDFGIITVTPTKIVGWSSQ